MGLEDNFAQWEYEYNTESYSKKEIDEQFEGFYEQLIVEMEEKYGKKTGNKNYFRIKAYRHRIKNAIVAQLHKELTLSDCISHTPYKTFYEVFSGNIATEPYAKIHWLKTATLATYFIDKLAENKWLDNHELDDKLERFFLKKDGKNFINASSTRGNINSNRKSDYKPKHNEIIDDIISKIDEKINP
jgi:hypothetical protein